MESRWVGHGRVKKNMRSQSRFSRPAGVNRSFALTPVRLLCP